MDVNLNDFRVPIASRIHIWWQWLWDRMRVGYLCGLDSGIFLWLKVFGGSWEHKSSEMSSPAIYTSIWAVFGCLCLHKYTWYIDGSWEDKSSEMSSLCPQGWTVFGCLFHHKYTCDGGGCQVEYVWGTCMDCMPLKPWYLQHPVSLAEVESVKVGTYRVRVYPPQFHRFVGAYSVTNTHVSVVVVRQNMHEVPVWTGIRDTSSIEGVWRELRAWTLNFDLIRIYLLWILQKVLMWILRKHSDVWLPGITTVQQVAWEVCK